VNVPAGQTGLRRHIPPLPPPTTAVFAPRPPLLGLKPARPFFPVSSPLLPTPPSDPMATNWERGLRSAKERLAKAKERKESESDFDDKRLNMSAVDDSQRYPPATRHAYPGRDPAHYSGRERRSPGSEQRSNYHASSSSQHYSYQSSHSQSRDYRHSHYSQQWHDESEYERRQRLAYQSAPRPEEWNDRGRTRPYPLLDRYGREIQRCSRPDDYVDKWKRSPVIKSERPVRESGDLSSISTSDSPSGLSGTSDSDSDGSWSDDDKDREKRVNHRTKKTVAPVVNPELQVASTSGMKRIPRLSDRHRDTGSPKRQFKSETIPDAAYSSKDRPSSKRENDVRGRSHKSSESDSDDEAELDDSKKRKGYPVQSVDTKRRRESHHSNGSRSPPLSRHSLTPSAASPGVSFSSPKREKERFVMDFVGKVIVMTAK
jgi:hypothetical protein